MWGTWLVAFCLYVLPGVIAGNPGSSDLTWALGVWGAVFLFACLWVYAGVRRARGPRDIMPAFWSLVFAGGCAYALFTGAYLDDAPALNVWLRGFYFATLAASLMALFIFTRGTGGNAARMVEQQIERQAIPWRTGKRRQF